MRRDHADADGRACEEQVQPGEVRRRQPAALALGHQAHRGSHAGVEAQPARSPEDYRRDQQCCQRAQGQREQEHDPGHDQARAAGQHRLARARAARRKLAPGHEQEHDRHFAARQQMTALTQHSDQEQCRYGRQHTGHRECRAARQHGTGKVAADPCGHSGPAEPEPAPGRSPAAAGGCPQRDARQHTKDGLHQVRRHERAAYRVGEHACAECAEGEAASVGGDRHGIAGAAMASREQVDHGRGSGARHQACSQTGDDTAEQQQAQARRPREDQRAEHADCDGAEQHRAPADGIGQLPERDEGHDNACCVHREQDGDRQRVEAESFRIQVVQRGWQRRGCHADHECRGGGGHGADGDLAGPDPVRHGTRKPLRFTGSSR